MKSYSPGAVATIALWKSAPMSSSVAGQRAARVHTDVSVTEQATHLLRQIAVVMSTMNLLERFVLEPRRQLRTTLDTRYVVAVLLTYRVNPHSQ